MDGKHPQKPDPRPRRRKDKDNPYTIFSVGINSDSPKFYMEFRDVAGELHCMEIRKELFDVLDQFELEDISFLNEMDRHYEQLEQSEDLINRRAVRQTESVEDLVFRRMEAERLHDAIAQLPEIQRRRLVLYYFGSFTYEQIAEIEGCAHTAVMKSVSAALKKIKKILSEGVTI